MPRSSSSGENNTTTAKPRARSTRATREPDTVTDRQAKSGNGAAAANGASAAAASEMPYSPSYDEIAEEAYQRYLRRGGQHGQDFDDWLEAERALKERRS